MDSIKQNKENCSYKDEQGSDLSCLDHKKLTPYNLVEPVINMIPPHKYDLNRKGWSRIGVDEWGCEESTRVSIQQMVNLITRTMSNEIEGILDGMTPDANGNPCPVFKSWRSLLNNIQSKSTTVKQIIEFMQGEPGICGEWRHGEFTAA